MITSTPPNDNPDDPQNYSPHGVEWTDNGVLIIEHETEIGASNDTASRPTTIRYYSLYMHLGAIARNLQTNAQWKTGDRIYRKDELGSPGRIYSHTGQIHFEICCDAANARTIIGRQPCWSEIEPPVAPAGDGRTDSVFGDIVVYLPAATPTSAANPTSHLRAASTTTLGVAQWVSIRYDKGKAYLKSYDALGVDIGTERSDANFEYDLYAEANRRHNSLGANSQGSSPSGWYELLRFGRNLGPTHCRPTRHIAPQRIGINLLMRQLKPPRRAAAGRAHLPTRANRAAFRSRSTWRPPRRIRAERQKAAAPRPRRRRACAAASRAATDS